MIRLFQRSNVHLTTSGLSGRLFIWDGLPNSSSVGNFVCLYGTVVLKGRRMVQRSAASL